MLASRAQVSEKRPEHHDFTTATFEGFLRDMRMNSIGNVVVVIETAYADRHHVFSMSDAGGEMLNIQVTRKL